MHKKRGVLTNTPFFNVRFISNYIFFTAAAKRDTLREAFFL